MDGAEGQASLHEERRSAAARIDEVERQWREAQASVAQASAARAEVERNGGSAATSRHKAEEALSTARQRSAEP
jgi:hypothetical protein